MFVPNNASVYYAKLEKVNDLFSIFIILSLIEIAMIQVLKMTYKFMKSCRQYRSFVFAFMVLKFYQLGFSLPMICFIYIRLVWHLLSLLTLLLQTM